MLKLKRFIGFLLVYSIVTLVLLELSLQALHLVFKPDDRAGKPMMSNALRIVTVGDSNTYGVYLEEKATWPAQLNSLWQQQINTPIEVINVGYPGTNTEMAARNMASVHKIFRPDVVLLMIGVNDFWSSPKPYTEDSKPSWASKLRIVKLYQLATRNAYVSSDFKTRDRQVFDPRTVDQEVLKKAIVKAIKERKDPVEAYISYGDEKIDVTRQPLGQNKELKPEETLVKNLEWIHRFCQNHGIKLVLVTYPSGQDIYGQANQLLRQFAQQSQLELIDSTPKVYGSCKPSGSCESLLFPDQHATAEGNNLVAGQVVDFFKQLQNPGTH